MAAQLELRLDDFIENNFIPYLIKAEQDGIRFTTMAALGDTVGARRQLYLLTLRCVADAHDRSGCPRTFEDFMGQRIEVGTYDPRGVVLALQNDQWVGMATASVRPGYGVSEATGVVRSWRGRGLSVALAVLAIRFVRASGKDLMRSAHEPANAAAVALNRRLGFVDIEC